MAIEWSFPSNNFGTLNGIGEAGIETFKGAPYRSLAREICQNSLDARSSKSKPVRVVFSLSSIQSRDIPRFEVLREALSRCLQFWKEQGNDKTVAFFKEATTVASLSAIDLLRISDFNTTGLTGSDKEYSTPWQDLVKASGVSSKGGSSGGSFGIGKSAPFACSKLRTVFYATRDINRLEAFQGKIRDFDGFTTYSRERPKRTGLCLLLHCCKRRSPRLFEPQFQFRLCRDIIRHRSRQHFGDWRPVQHHRDEGDRRSRENPIDFFHLQECR